MYDIISKSKRTRGTTLYLTIVDEDVNASTASKGSDQKNDHVKLKQLINVVSKGVEVLAQPFGNFLLSNITRWIKMIRVKTLVEFQ
ncbi:hypothetical protein BVRB_006210 [Beta vulgaris subsp. vulgaris]|uniref:Uncharacterized protein n=1 Tax=Beta vulgaris subsp. vulgaris TaxID=3555 RepID=A0A0J8B3T2_BETVV|nr:hypothetical protein BVRB_006210 [Beta vulgaris subsp. vulgaris]